MNAHGPSFLALQVSDLERSASFYETHLGLTRSQAAPPHAVVFETSPIPFAVREPLPGFDPRSAQPFAGAGVVLWLAVDDAEQAHEALARAGVDIVAPPSPSPFGPMFTFRDPDGYAVTLHSQAS
ncbi:VOC family protein [Nocardioides sp. Kera G14]|uniref:VOC family protein n=1 Tax=Nocardioides sp. Kera G14 TaxID=2884264 RepID=UPI001D12A726|nr:VOC family protein [Nocardioides sp. Kera G14]UDY23635.1 VOC family protein [Nocardioides sp. Kera G14]